MKPKAAALLRVAARWRARPFAYGVADCCQFAREVVLEVTGVDHGREWTYGSEEEAQRIIDAHDGLEGLVSRYLGPPCNADELEIGDPCLIRAPGFEMLGVRSGRGAYAPSSRGLVVAVPHRIRQGWSL